jgi:TPP-dependent pyruvate/acetoin dehydrogenase alpha subunit
MAAGADTALHAVEPIEESEGFSLISNARLWEIYAAMMKCRMTAEAAPKGGLAACVGWEAAVAAVTVDLHAEDALSTTAASTLAALVKGVSAAAMARGKATEKDLLASRVLPQTANDAARLHAACGVALAEKLRKSGRVVAAFLSHEDGTRAGTCEALKFCRAQQLPMVLVDLHATSTQATLADGKEKEALAYFAGGVPVIAVDGSDAVAVYRVASEALGRARQDRGPTVIECLGPAHEAMLNWFGDDHDPVKAMESYLQRKGLFQAARKSDLKAKIARELRQATGTARK